ncbi:MAG: hypothetical protein E7442_09310 [Ruminococcaceae bacterium]|nr:hypothetical protein [Oscillospiraceae bacterium]
MQVKERLPLKRILLGAAVLLALLLIVVLAFPNPAVQEPEATPPPTPAPTPRPTPAPAAATPEPEIYRPDNIYYQYDPALFVTDERGRITYTGEGYTSLTGIDVSEHQYDINWQQVAADGIDFAIIRSGYRGYSAGSLNEDKYFRQNMDGATAAGLPIGIYFFSQATSVREARDEANYVLDQIKDYNVTLPVVYDLEILGQNYRTYNMSRRTIYECARAFCDTVREAGYEPMIYMTQYLGYQKYTLRELTDYGFWFAEYYVNYPSFVYDFEIWQYSDTGRVAGVNGNVDLDLWLVPEE